MLSDCGNLHHGKLRRDKGTKLLPHGGSLVRAKATVDACVVGIVERWSESLAIFAAAFPWTSFGTARSRKMHRQRSHHLSMRSLSFAKQEALSQALDGDMELYTHATRKFKRQVDCYLGGERIWQGTNPRPQAAASNPGPQAAASNSRSQVLGDSRSSRAHTQADSSSRQGPLLELVDDYATGRATSMHRGGWRSIMGELIGAGVVRGMQAGGNRRHRLLKQRQNWQADVTDEPIAFVDCVEHMFAFGNFSPGPLTRPWVGVIHFVGGLPRPPFEAHETLEGVLTRPDFVASLPHCLVLFVLSEACAAYARALIPGVPVQVILHPAPQGLVPFDMHAFETNRNRSVIFVGAQYRRTSTLYALRGVPHHRVWLSGRGEGQRLKHFNRFVLPSVPTARIDEVRTDFIASWSEYDRLQRENVVLLDFYGVSACNSLLQCAAARLPCLVRRMPANEEYIGKGYPMFFDSVDEVRALLLSPQELLYRAREATAYFSLLKLEQGPLSFDSFRRRLRTLVHEAVWRVGQLQHARSNKTTSGGEDHPNRLDADRSAGVAHTTPEQLVRCSGKHPLPSISNVSMRHSPRGVGTERRAEDDDATLALAPTTKLWAIDSNCHVSGREAVRIAVAFYGLSARSIRHTLPGIRSHLLHPLRTSSAGAVDVFVHSLAAQYASGVAGDGTVRIKCETAFLALEPCRAASVEQTQIDAMHDTWKKANRTVDASKALINEHNDLPTVANIYRSRVSKSEAGKLVRRREREAGVLYSIVVVARPDTSLASPLVLPPITELSRADVWVPDFAHGHGPSGASGGVNDRFAFGLRTPMVESYMAQYEGQLSGAAGVRMVDSEQLLCRHLASRKVRIGFHRVCIIRVRADGKVPEPDLDPNDGGPRKRCSATTDPGCCNADFVHGAQQVGGSCPTFGVSRRRPRSISRAPKACVMEHCPESFLKQLKRVLPAAPHTTQKLPLPNPFKGQTALQNGTPALKWCTKGVVSPNGQVCCDAQCGKCGGKFCATRKGGRGKCSGTIFSSGKVCENHDATACICRDRWCAPDHVMRERGALF